MNGTPGNNGFDWANSPSQAPDGQDQSRFMPQGPKANPGYPTGGYASPRPQNAQGPWMVNNPYPPPAWGTPAYHPDSWHKPKRSRAKIVAALASVTGVLLLGVGAWLFGDASKVSFEAISEKCENEYSAEVLYTISGAKQSMEELGVEGDEETWESVPRVITVNSDSSSIVVDDRGFYSVDKADYLSGSTGSTRERLEEFADQMNSARDLAILSAVDCIHAELDIPESAHTRMLSTRAMDGIQEVTHSGIRVTWNYHPSSGLDVIYEKE